MTSRHHVLSRKASISLQTMHRGAHDLLPRIPTAALSAGLTTTRKKITRGSTRRETKEQAAPANMKKNTRPTPTSPLAESHGRVRVKIEPADPEAQARLMSQLAKIGATRVRQIARGFVSAEVSIADIPGLKEIAHTGILPTKQLR